MRTVSLEVSPIFLPTRSFIHFEVLSSPPFDDRPGTTRGILGRCKAVKERLEVAKMCSKEVARKYWTSTSGKQEIMLIENKVMVDLQGEVGGSLTSLRRNLLRMRMPGCIEFSYSVANVKSHRMERRV